MCGSWFIFVYFGLLGTSVETCELGFNIQICTLHVKYLNNVVFWAIEARSKFS